MRFENIWFALDAAWSSPFARWQGPAGETNSLKLAERAARIGLARSGVEWPIGELVLGQTVPQRESFYGPLTAAARTSTRSRSRSRSTSTRMSWSALSSASPTRGGASGCTPSW